VQVAATLYVVGKDVVNFPKAQVERVVDAYIGELLRTDCTQLTPQTSSSATA
jgi:hypothetical protein